jgi:hypothetical protein
MDNADISLNRRIRFRQNADKFGPSPRARKRAARAQAQTEITALLAWLIMCLLMFGPFYEKFGQ